MAGMNALPTHFPPAVYAHRIKRAETLCTQRGLGGAVVGTGPELAFLTGTWTQSHERLTALVISPLGEPTLIAPATDAADLAFVEQLGITLHTWRDGHDPYRIVAAHLGGGTVALGKSLTADHVLRLMEVVEDTVLIDDAVPDLFMVKDTDEIAQLEFAAAAIDRVHEQVPDLLRPSRTENEVAADLAELIKREHASVDFVIVGSGPNGANPHHDHSDRVLEDGDPVVVDIGGSVGAGYHSDCTRTYVAGTVQDPSFQRAYDVLRTAQDTAVHTARPGMTAGELDAVARSIINHAGYGVNFSHRLGHGIGLALHEAPFIVEGSDTVLEEGMVFSIEPGIYLPGQWGMRIEDIVVLEPAGARRLNNAARQLRYGLQS